MNKKTTFIIRGIAFGFLAGLCVTFFDALFLLKPNLYIPLEYPVYLFSFNLIFWMLIGAISGICLWLFIRLKNIPLEGSNYYCMLFFLVPFVSIYGVLGRVSKFCLTSAASLFSKSFDYNLSLLWALLFMFFLIVTGKKHNKKKYSSLLFLPEVITAIALFLFCSNLSSIPLLRSLLIETPILRIIVLWCIYVLGLVLIVGIYSFALKIQPLTVKRPAVSILVIFAFVSLALSGSFIKAKYALVKNYYTPRESSTAAVEPKISHVFLIVLDTLRSSDLVRFEKMGRNLKEFANDALVYENCIATSSWTAPSHASLFTGFYPIEHGVHYRVENKGSLRLSEEFNTLAEVFKENGYRTTAIVANCINLRKDMNFNQGFEVYDDTPYVGSMVIMFPFKPLVHLFSTLSHIQPKINDPLRPARHMNKCINMALSSVGSDPSFMFINYSDPHTPYLPPRPYNSRYSDRRFPHLYKIKRKLSFPLKRTPKDPLYELSQYRGEIDYLDDHLGQLFAELKRRGIYDSSLIVVTSDHGEAFGEHGFSGHNNQLYEDLVNVPLMVKYPGKTKISIETAQVSLKDVYWGILSSCNLSGKLIARVRLSQPPGDWKKQMVLAECYYLRLQLGKHRALYMDNFKLMNYEKGKKPELYNLLDDPMEKSNLYENLPQVFEKLSSQMQKWEAVHAQKEHAQPLKTATPSLEIQENLKTLGYIH